MNNQRLEEDIALSNYEEPDDQLGVYEDDTNLREFTLFL